MSWSQLYKALITMGCNLLKIIRLILNQLHSAPSLALPLRVWSAHPGLCSIYLCVLLFSVDKNEPNQVNIHFLYSIQV